MKNISNQTPERRFENIIADLQRKVEELRTNQLRYLFVPKVEGDPTSPTNGQLWYDTTTNQLKVYKNGSVRTVTTS